jgi:hypothetical protein
MLRGFGGGRGCSALLAVRQPPVLPKPRLLASSSSRNDDCPSLPTQPSVCKHSSGALRFVQCLRPRLSPVSSQPVAAHRSPPRPAPRCACPRTLEDSLERTGSSLTARHRISAYGRNSAHIIAFSQTRPSCTAVALGQVATSPKLSSAAPVMLPAHPRQVAS